MLVHWKNGVSDIRESIHSLHHHRIMWDLRVGESSDNRSVDRQGPTEPDQPHHGGGTATGALLRLHLIDPDV